MKPKIEEKSWEPRIEKLILDRWNSQSIYAFTADQDNKPPFVIDTPPPYPSGRPWHMGAAAHYAQIDMIARTARMSGFNVLFPIGIDRNGLPVEIYTEKKYKIRMRETPREKFLELCRISLDELEAEMIQIMKLIGIGADFKNYYRTDSESYRKLTQETFIDLWNSGLIYLANRPNNYCPDCGTTLADAEIVYSEIPTRLVYMKFKVVDPSGDIIIASTRPELLFACQAVVVNPGDERYLKLHGKEVIIPIFHRKVKLIPHPSAKEEFGSGAVMVCSYGDQNDLFLFRELGLEEIVALGENGRLTEKAGDYSGLRINQARIKIIEDLKSKDLVEKEENILHRTPICERSKTPIEIIPLHDYYLRQIDYLEKIRAVSQDLKFYPEMHRQILTNWLDSISIDWPISRRRFYGTEIPIWYCSRCGIPNIPDKGKYYMPWKEQAPFEKCRRCESTEFIGEERVFDTWMDSSISCLYITKYGLDKKFFSYTYPASIRPQAKDIIRTWLYYSMLRCYQITERLPWSGAWIMGYGVDEKGEKMSKSKGNVIDPLPLIEQYGADSFRFWSASESSLGYDFRCSREKISGAQKFLSKLWNIGRFLSSFELVSSPSHLEPTDKWILSELSMLVQKCINGYKEYNFFIVANSIREFTWNLFAAHYIEMVKWRAYGSSIDNSYDKKLTESAVYTLHTCFSTIMILLSPICPFITDEIWTRIYSDRPIHVQLLPPQSFMNEYLDMEKYTSQILEFNSKVWNAKKETISPVTGKPLSLKDSIKMQIPDQLIGFSKDLSIMHNLV